MSIEDTIYEYQGKYIAGLGGSMAYNGGKYQFTDKAMNRRVIKLMLKMKLKRIKHLDLFVAHAPAYKLNDSDDLPHTGFAAFYKILDRVKPSVFAHGHVHINYGRDFKRDSDYNGVRVVNAYEKYIIEI